VEEVSLQMLLGPYGLTVAAVTVAVGLTRAVIHLHRLNQELQDKRMGDQKQYLGLVETQQQYHMEQQRLIERAIMVMDRLEGRIGS
jgi:hypothetical protein